MRVRVGRWVIQSMLALAAASASGQSRPPASAPAPVAASAPAPAASAVQDAAAQPQAPVSLSARKVYEQARSQLVQIRTSCERACS